MALLSTPTTANQIDAWRAAKTETEKLEFKEAKNQFDFETLLSYCVAFANERGGILLLGIANKPPRPVIGTSAYPNIVKLTEDLFNRLRFRVDIEEIQHPDGRVLAFHIPSRPIGHPYHLDGKYYMRSGESLVAMSPDHLKRIISEQAPKRRMVIGFIVAILVLTVVVFLFVRYWAGGEKPAVGPINHEQHSESPAAGPVDWHDKQNWRKYLRVGMTRTEIRRLFGDAERIRVLSEFEVWDYGSGEIQFDVNADSPDGALYSWDEPH